MRVETKLPPVARHDGGGTGAAQREFGAAIQVVLQAATSLTEQVLDAQAHLWQT